MIANDYQRDVAAVTLRRLEAEIDKQQAAGVPHDVVATMAVRIAKVRREIAEYDDARSAGTPEA